MKISEKTKTLVAYLFCMAVMILGVRFIEARLGISSEFGSAFVLLLMIITLLLPLVYLLKKAMKYDAMVKKEKEFSKNKE